MRTIIAGSRSATREHLIDAMYSYDAPITVVISGACPDGADALGAEWARERGIEVEEHPADWKRFGHAAGPIRNRFMAEKTGAQALLAIWDGKSRGTANMIYEARRRGLRVTVHYTGARVVFDNLIGADAKQVRHLSRHARAMREAHHWLDIVDLSPTELRAWSADRPVSTSGEIEVRS